MLEFVTMQQIKVTLRTIIYGNHQVTKCTNDRQLKVNSKPVGECFCLGMQARTNIEISQ